MEKGNLLCDDKYESVSHVLWKSAVYSSDRRNYFRCKLQELVMNGCEFYESLDSFEKVSFVLGSVELTMYCHMPWNIGHIVKNWKMLE